MNFFIVYLRRRVPFHVMERLFDYWRGKSVTYWLHRMMKSELYDPAIRWEWDWWLSTSRSQQCSTSIWWDTRAVMIQWMVVIWTTLWITCFTTISFEGSDEEATILYITTYLLLICRNKICFSMLKTWIFSNAIDGLDAAVRYVVKREWSVEQINQFWAYRR